MNFNIPVNKRFVKNQKRKYNLLINASKKYVKNLRQERKKFYGFNYLFSKPYDKFPYNKEYYVNMFDILSLLKTMRIKPGGKVLEVGCGPGWVTEILMALNYKVDAIEPCEDFIKIAKKRINSLSKHLHLTFKPKVNFYSSTLEKFKSSANKYDGIIFYAVFHHLVDENISLKKCFHMLKPGGILGIHEGAWKPGCKEIEENLVKEMEAHGTLESPFTTEYMDYLLEKHGFIKRTRYHQVNGLFSADSGSKTVRETAQALAEDYNIVTAIKPYRKTMMNDEQGKTSTDIVILNSNFIKSQNRLTLQVEITNNGNTIWLTKAETDHGWISIALFQGEKNTNNYIEAEPRNLLPKTILPKEKIKTSLNFKLPKNRQKTNWTLDLIKEDYFWFSEKGVKPKKILIV